MTHKRLLSWVAAGAVALALTGFGTVSLDAVTGLAEFWTPALVLATLAAGVIGGAGMLLVRRPQTAKA